MVRVLVAVLVALGSWPGFAEERSGESRQVGAASTVVFERVEEPREKAFTLLVPKGWQLKGGVFRLDPTASGGPGNAVAAKVDLTLQSDDAGSVLIRFLPDYVYFDMRQSPAGQMGLFPTGSVYQGMPVYPKMGATDFVRQLVFPYVHGHGKTAPTETTDRALTKLAAAFRKRVLAWGLGLDFTYDAAVVSYEVQIGDKQTTEQVLAVVEDWGALGAGMWGNKATLLVRAPKEVFKEMVPVFGTVIASVQMNPKWVEGELRGQQERGRIVLETQQEIQRVGREITEHHQKTYDEINHEMFLNLMGQEEYVNPHTGKVETGTNSWNRRWEAPNGTVVYTNDSNYDPNRDKQLKRDDFKRSKVHKRK